MTKSGQAVHILLFLAFLAFAIIFLIGPGVTSLAVARAESVPTGMSVGAVVLAIVFPVILITLYVVVQAYKTIKRDRHG